MLIDPCERSGNPAGGGRLGGLGDSEHCDWTASGDFDFDDFPLRAVGNRCCGTMGVPFATATQLKTCQDGSEITNYDSCQCNVDGYYCI